MLNELLSIFRSDNPLKVMAGEFGRMLETAREMVSSAGDIFFRQSTSPEERTRIYEKDVTVNRLERTIRKQVVTHLSITGNTPDLPYCLLLMSLVKDVERLGDYAKNLSEVVDVYSGELPEDEVLAELREIRVNVEETFRSASTVFTESDRERALSLIRQGKVQAKRADALLSRIAHSDYTAGQTAALVLCARYYKRIGGHLINVLSSVVMPLHKIDYYDEDEIPG